MKDVARASGVSVQTVSAVVNDKPGITDATRARVLAAVEELGYVPFPYARSMRTRKTRTIAFIVPNIANPSFATMASAVEDFARGKGYSVMIYNTARETFPNVLIANPFGFTAASLFEVTVQAEREAPKVSF